MNPAPPAPRSSQSAQESADQSRTGGQSAMEPVRDPAATLPDLLEVLLNKGVHLNLDLIISVADIPLIGVNLRATIAGIETMLEYGMMRQWDEQTRAWVQKSLAKRLPMAPGEEVLAAMAASHYQEDFHRTWRAGRAYLTTHRLIIHRRDPAETLWQAPLTAVASVEPVHETAVGGEERTRISVELEDGSRTKISAADPEQLMKLVRKQLNQPHRASAREVEAASGPRLTGSMWYLETLSAGATWRGGRGTLGAPSDDEPEFTWKSPMDGRASIRLRPSDVESIQLEEHRNPTDHSQALRIETPQSTLLLASGQLQDWLQHLTEWSNSSKEAARGPSSR